MKKIIVTCFLVASCGSITKDKQSIKEEVIVKENASKYDFKRYKDSSFTLRPFDASKPMIYGKDTLVNMVIENIYRDRVHIVKDTIEKTNVKVYQVESKNKVVDNSKVYLYAFGFGFFFIALIVIVCFYIISKKFRV